MASSQRSDGSGCGGCLAIFFGILVIALFVMALISLVAIVDPFSWMPTVGKIWKDCQDNYATARNDCALANRFHGFWLHAVINLVYLVAALTVLGLLAASAGRLRETRDSRFNGSVAVVRYGDARTQLAKTAAIGAALALLPFVAGIARTGAVTAEGGSVGGVVAALVLLAVVSAMWPSQPGELERRHRELHAAWREARVDADEEVPWDRFAAWARPVGGSVEIALLRCRPVLRGPGGAPSPFRLEVLQTIDAEDVGRAATAMEKARAAAAERELAAQQRHVDAGLRSEQLAHERRLAAIDQAAAADLEAREAAIRRELAEQEAAERRTQAEALAKALRRP